MSKIHLKIGGGLSRPLRSWSDFSSLQYNGGGVLYLLQSGAIHFTLTVNIYKKHDTFRYVTFLYTKNPTLQKNQTNLRYVF